LKLVFEQADSEELKGMEVTFNGDKAIFKLGEGESSHFHIPNDKKLWETQFMIVCINGQYFIRDMGYVHSSRIKLDKECEVQIQKGSVVDLGKVIHYHFDKVIHQHKPATPSGDNFYILRSEIQPDVDESDYSHLRARPTWVSADENVDNIQNEINIYEDTGKEKYAIGRSMKRDIQIKLKAVSADHCQIAYNK